MKKFLSISSFETRVGSTLTTGGTSLDGRGRGTIGSGPTEHQGGSEELNKSEDRG